MKDREEFRVSSDSFKECQNRTTHFLCTLSTKMRKLSIQMQHLELGENCPKIWASISKNKAMLKIKVKIFKKS